MVDDCIDSSLMNRRVVVHIACVLTLVVCLLGGLSVQRADAKQWFTAQPSLTPSTTSPYYACGSHSPGHPSAHCMMLIYPLAYKKHVAEEIEKAPSSQRPSWFAHFKRTIAGEKQDDPQPSVNHSELGLGIEGKGLPPSTIQELYALPSSSAGYGQTVGIVDAHNDPNIESDLNVYRSTYGLPPCQKSNGCFEKLNQSGKESSYPTNSGSWAAEISVDVDAVSAVCPNCHIHLIETNNEEVGSLAAGDETAVKSGATEVSNSWAFGEEELTEETKYDHYFDHPGVMFFAAGGDSGYGVKYPASSPYVMSVGGTYVEEVQEGGKTTFHETEAWKNTGAGCSKYEPKPVWQTDPECHQRMGNDISAAAAMGEAGPVSTYDSYKAEGLGNGWEDNRGTSVSSPLIAGIYALTNEYTRSFGPQAIYKYREEGGTLHDITLGNDYLVRHFESCLVHYFCYAGSGFDGPTGWGTPWGAPVVKPPPVVSTLAASNVLEKRATLNGSVVPEGLDTHYYFQYGESAGYGWVTSEVDAGSGTGSVPASSVALGLYPGTTYHFRLVATSSAGTVYGGDRSFTTTQEPSVAFADANTNNEIGVWRWTEEAGWTINRLYQDAATAGTSPSAVLNKNVANVFFADANTNNEVSEWSWSWSTGWSLTRFYQDAVAAGTSPVALMVNGVPNVLFVDANTSNTISDWVWSPTAGWQLSRFYSDKVTAGTGLSAVMNNGVLNVFFDDATAGNTIADWQWGTVELKLSHFYGDTVAPGTSPSAVVNNGVLDTFFDDATAGNTIADWLWAPTELKVSHFYGDTVAAGTSPDAVVNNGILDTFFDDAAAGNTIADWLWAPTELKLSHFYGDAVTAKTSPSTILKSSVPMTFFTDAATNNEISYWQWSPSELSINRLYQDAATTGTSPSAIE
jgi:hypothetical protein